MASAAVPVFAVCDHRIAAPGSIFMVHQAAVWVWPGRETASDIRSKNELMILLQDKYIDYLVRSSKLTAEQWKVKINGTTWFSVEQGIEWGIIDEVQ